MLPLLAVLTYARDRLATALDQLQTFQDVEAAGDAALQLAPVNYQTPEGLLSGALRRTFDFLFRPFPWQVENIEQQAGALGTLIVWTLLFCTAASVILGGQAALRRTWPLIVAGSFTTLGYAVTMANAGTGFRHRIHLVLFAVATCCIAFECARWSRADGGPRFPGGRKRRDRRLTTGDGVPRASARLGAASSAADPAPAAPPRPCDRGPLADER